MKVKYEVNIVPTATLCYEIEAVSEEQAKLFAKRQFQLEYPLLHVHTISAKEINYVGRKK